MPHHLDDDEDVPIERLVVTVNDAARMLGIGKTKLNELGNSGVIERRHIGRRTVYTIASLKRFVATLKE